MGKMVIVCLSVGLHCWLDDVFACSAWLRDEEHQLINRISLRTNAMTNLTLDSVEELQVRCPSKACPPALATHQLVQQRVRTSLSNASARPSNACPPALATFVSPLATLVCRS